MFPLAFIGHIFYDIFYQSPAVKMFSIAEAPAAATLVVRLDSIITTELLLGYVAPRGLANNCPVHNGNNHNLGGRC